MCFDPNAKIAGVRPSDYGYDVKLNDGTYGNVGKDPSDPYYEDVQNYIAATTPPTGGSPNPAPSTGKLSLNSIRGENGGEPVRSITDTQTGGRYGIGTRTTTDASGTGTTVDSAPPTLGNIAQAAANAIGIIGGGPGMAGTIGGMLTNQAQNIGGGQVASAIDGVLKPVAQTSPAGGGGNDRRGMSRSEREATAQGRRTTGRMAELNSNISRGFGFGGGGGGGRGGGRSPGGSSRGARGE